MLVGMVDGLAEVLHLYRTGRLDDAEARCRAIVDRDPACGEAWDRLARITERQGHPEQAEVYYQRAIPWMAQPAEAHNNLAVLLQRRGDRQQALDHYRRAIALGLRHATVHSNLGSLLRDAGHLQEAADELARALVIDGSLAHAHSNLGVTLALQGQLDRALPHLRQAVALQPDWDVAHSNLLFCLNYADDLTPQQLAAQHFAFGRRHPAPETPASHGDPVPDADRKLRVGFVSPDLKQHSVAYFIEPLLAAGDRDLARDAFEIVCYADVMRPDSVTERLRAAADRWRSIAGLSDPDVARLVRADRIDILIDLAGHTAGNRLSLFATRVAPVQMTYLGYCNTTGLDTVDWRITDAWADPPGMTESLHSEALLRLAGGFLCFLPRAASPAPEPPPARASGRITFGSFNLQAKISPATIALWAQILDRVPGSRLCLKAPAFADPATRSLFEQRLASSPLAGHDVTLWGHLADEREHLAAYGQIDIALDTWPYGGTTTTCEALWMGVPVVTLAGRAHAARVGASLLSRLGQPDLVADSPAAYVAAAVRLAADADRRATLRTTLRARMTSSSSGITDATAFARDFGQAMRHAWRIHCQQARASTLAPPPGTRLAPMAGNLRVVVPDTLDQITPYVLAEQHDWFEDEIVFVRAVLLRGERAIDIGANHGVYALTLARRVGDGGRVWAFEPGRAVAARLRASIAINDLAHASVVEAALTDHEGDGQLVSDNDQSELGQLTASDACDASDTSDTSDASAATQRRETVALLTLDGCRGPLGIAGVAFVKIDAEGAEAAIIDGGRGFFTTESPLVMFEVRHNTALNLDLLQRFQWLGYRAFRLIPGLGILAPFDDRRALDPFALNLFACKPDRAALLETRGLLTTALPPPEPNTDTGTGIDVGAGLTYLRAQLFAAPLWPRWSTFVDAQAADPRAPDSRASDSRASDSIDQAYARCLDRYACARRITDPPAARHAALDGALQIITACARARADLPVLQTLARIACEAGERVVAVQALNLLVERCAVAITGTVGAGAGTGADAELDRPFLPVSPRFDHIPPGEDDGDRLRWVMAAALEQRERLRNFSSFFAAADPATLACLETIATLGYQSPEMARRLALAKGRAA